MKLRIPTYWDEERANFVDAPVFSYPEEKELLSIFPEAREIVPMKLKEELAKEPSPERDYQVKRLKRLTALLDPKTSGKFQKWENALAQAKEVPIQDLFEFERLRRTGRGWEARCPLGHTDKTPSFVIYPDNKWRCFSCGKFGDGIDLISLVKNLTVKEAVGVLNGN